MQIDDLETGEAGGGVIPPRGNEDEQGDDSEDALQDDRGCDEAIDELEEQLDIAQSRIEELERQLSAESARSDLERQLVEAGAVDLETAMVLAERKLAEGGMGVAETVESLKNTKGFLFRRPVSVSGASALAGTPMRSRDSLEDLARQAQETGDRRAVLRYLRKRRA